MKNMTKKDLIKSIKPRYLKSSKDEKGKILDEFCVNTGFHRKYAIGILSAKFDNNLVSSVGRKPRKKKYNTSLIVSIIKIWKLLEHPCGVRLKSVLVSTAKAMMRFGELSVNDDDLILMENISARTLDRRLEKTRVELKLNRNRGTTRHGSLLKSSIPIRLTNWDTAELGFMEMDTVAHNGGDPAGEFIYSLDMVEIATGWSEQRAVLGKGKQGVVNMVDEIKEDVPFKIYGLDSDGGSEFINWHMVKYCEENEMSFTRSKAYMKNDNAYVEQKNYTHIRKWLGYGRYDTRKQLNMINNLYKTELRLFNNFFRPVMKIESKEKINNSVCKKKYDQTQTPYQRLIASNQVSKERKLELEKLYLLLNPVQLKKVIKEKIEKIKKTTKPIM